MSDDTTLQVQIARLEGRLEGVERAINRAEHACEERARSHVDTTLYLSERDATRNRLDDALHQIATLRAALDASDKNCEHAVQAARDEAERRMTDYATRVRWIVGGVAVPLVGLLITLVLS